SEDPGPAGARLRGAGRADLAQPQREGRRGRHGCRHGCGRLAQAEAAAEIAGRMQARQALLRGGDGARAIPIGPPLLAAVPLARLRSVRRAPTRLLLGRPVGFITAAGMAGTGPVLAFGAAVLLLLLPSLFPARPGARWLSLLGAGLTLAAAAWLAGRAADSF